MWLMDQKQSQTARILKALKQKGGVANYELSRISLKYSSRISELRQDGHKVLAVRQLDHAGHMSGTWRYYLKDEDNETV